MGESDAVGGNGAAVGTTSQRVVRIEGAEALDWLDRLVTADLSGLRPGGSRRSLLLSATGGVLASFTVIVTGDGVLLLQDPREPRPIDELLDRYVLSSDVRLSDRTGDPSAAAPPPTDAAVVDAQRIERGIPRVGVDTAYGDMPAEVGLDDLVSYDKGCFLGQEAVAKARNLGHPRRVLLRLGSDRAVRAGDVVTVDGAEAGVITSSARSDDGGTMSLARIAWAYRDAALRTADGVELRVRT
jgi:tRNA-modifying protein YgfZ